MAKLPVPYRSPMIDSNGLPTREWLQFWAGIGGGTTSFSFRDPETPTGNIDGVNNVFTLAQNPNPVSSLWWIWNGLKIKIGVGITVSGNKVTCLAGYIPQIGDTVEVYYRF